MHELYINSLVVSGRHKDRRQLDISHLLVLGEYKDKRGDQSMAGNFWHLGGSDCPQVGQVWDFFRLDFCTLARCTEI